MPLNVDTKIMSRALPAKLKKTLPIIISSNQIAYVNKGCISESGGRLISDIIEVCKKILGMGMVGAGDLVTMDIEKAFLRP